MLGFVLEAAKGRAGEAYFVTDGRPVVYREFVTKLLATQSIPEPTRSIPSGLARAAAASGAIDRMAAWVSGQECTIDTAKARSELGYAPVCSPDDGLAELRGSE